jgi:hypothetical protein
MSYYAYTTLHALEPGQALSVILCDINVSNSSFVVLSLPHTPVAVLTENLQRLRLKIVEMIAKEINPRREPERPLRNRLTN